jgi:hypothetical protein
VILWSYAPLSTKCTFTLSGQDPYIGLVYYPVDGRLHDTTQFLDPTVFQMVSRRRFPAPATDAFWLYLDESYLPDGRYLVTAIPDSVGGDPTVYEVLIKSGCRVSYLPPAGVSPPPFCIVTGAEFDPAGNPIIDMRIRALLEPKKNSSAVAAWGRVAGETSALTDVGGNWQIMLAPTDRLIPKTRYRIIRDSILTGRDEHRGLYIPDEITATLNDVIVITSIKDGEITPSGPQEPPLLPPGYVLMTGQAVDVIGQPMANLEITIGTAYQQVPTVQVPNQIGQTADAAVIMPETRFITKTPPDSVKTLSGYPSSPLLTDLLPIGSEIISVTDGFGETYAPPFFSYIPTTGALTFTQPFVGLVRYRVPSDGKFSVALAPAKSYWIQIGPKAIRIPFHIYGGIAAFDVGSVVYAPCIK